MMQPGIPVELLESVVDLMEDGVVVSLPDGSVVYHNPVILDMFGLSKDSSPRMLGDIGEVNWNRRMNRAAFDAGSQYGIAAASDRTMRFEEKVTAGSTVRIDRTGARTALEQIVDRGEPLYGVTTGFGLLSEVAVPAGDRVRLQENLVRSHAAGVGEPFPVPVARAMTLLRANVLESAMPSMITAAALAISHQLAPRLAAALVGYGILLSLLTLPAWAWLLQRFG